MSQFKVHQVEWNDQIITQFWNGRAVFADEEVSFSKQVGKDLLSLVNRTHKIKGRKVLDYGCGTGHLISMLLNYDPDHVYGCDVSEENLKKVIEKNGSASEILTLGLIASGRIPMEDNSVDMIICVEVLEHLDDAQLSGVIKEFNRVLNKSGVLIVTVPNNEDLVKNSAICPECGAFFHRMQHMRVWNSSSLRDCLSSNFNVNRTYETVLKHNGFFGALMSITIKVGYKLLKRSMPHLVYLGIKKNG